LSKKNVFDFQE